MARGEVRIIGGVWRGRKLLIPDVPGLRPTPDRVRETVFNWLSPYLPGARCLDLFAGTGAFGFEALSRGASFVQLVDDSSKVSAALTNTAAQLACDRVNILQANIPNGLKQPDQPFDIVFLDPPYAANLVYPVCFYLESHAFLASMALIYVEWDQPIENDALPAGWVIRRAKQAGQVYYHLIQREELKS